MLLDVYSFGLYVFDAFLDVVFPRSCVGCGTFGTYLCNACYKTIRFFKHPLCPGCMKAIHPLGVHTTCTKGIYLDGLVAVSAHKGVIHELISQIKYKGHFDMVDELARIGAKTLYQYFHDKHIRALIPVPLHRGKLYEREFNQSEILSKKLSTYLSVPTATNVLYKRKATQAQATLSKQERHKNLQDVFFCKKRLRKGTTLLLIDDVSTTGTTLNECARALKQSGAGAVYGFVIAHGSS